MSHQKIKTFGAFKIIDTRLVSVMKSKYRAEQPAACSHACSKELNGSQALIEGVSLQSVLRGRQRMALDPRRLALSPNMKQTLLLHLEAR